MHGLGLVLLGRGHLLLLLDRHRLVLDRHTHHHRWLGNDWHHGMVGASHVLMTLVLRSLALVLVSSSSLDLSSALIVGVVVVISLVARLG